MKRDKFWKYKITYPIDFKNYRWEEGYINEMLDKQEAIEFLKKHRLGMSIMYLEDLINNKKYSWKTKEEFNNQT